MAIEGIPLSKEAIERLRKVEMVQQVSAPEPEMLEDEGEEQPEREQPQEDSKPGWSWIGSPDRPEAKEHSDGVSDLFEVPAEDDLSDLISVDIERDVIDGNLDDLTEVSEEDILGDEETGQVPLEYEPDVPRRKPLPRYRRTPPRYVPPRYVPPTSAGGTGGVGG